MASIDYKTSFGLTVTIGYTVEDVLLDNGRIDKCVDWWPEYLGARKVDPKEKLQWFWTKLTKDDCILIEAECLGNYSA